MGAHPTTKRKASSPDAAQAAIAEFLNTHYTHAHVNDVGPTLGRLAALREGPAADAMQGRQWHAAVSAALTGQAPSTSTDGGRLPTASPHGDNGAAAGAVRRSG